MSCQATKHWFLLHGLDLCTARNLNKAAISPEEVAVLEEKGQKKKTPKQGIGFVSKSTQWTCLSSEDNLLYRTYVTSYHLEIPLKARLVSFSCFLAVEWLSEFRFCFTSSAPIKESFLFPFPFRSWLSVGSQVTDVFFYSWIFVALSSRRIDRGNFIIRQFLQYF